MTECMLPAVVFDGVIDVSHHNGAIDWPAVASAGIALAFIKATQGAAFVDPTFERNRDGAIKAGVLAVPDHCSDTADADDQADHFLDVTALGDGQPAMIDWESAATAEAVVALGLAVADCAKRDPLIYYGYSQLAQAGPELSRWPLMLPAYPRGNMPGRYSTLVELAPRLPPGRASEWSGAARPYDFHQYTPAGRVAGITGPVDRSVWIGTAADLLRWHATGALPATTAPAAPSS